MEIVLAALLEYALGKATWHPTACKIGIFYFVKIKNLERLVAWCTRIAGNALVKAQCVTRAR